MAAAIDNTGDRVDEGIPMETTIYEDLELLIIIPAPLIIVLNRRPPVKQLSNPLQFWMLSA